MSQVITAQLQRNDAQPWGFRLQGGKDFGTPLVIQKVNTGSIADNAGLKAGDAVVRLNSTDLYNLRHKEAQDAIVKAGPSFELVIQRGGATWKPTVTPIGSAAPSPLPGNYTPVTKTSLAANKQQVSNFGSGHNSAARPFIPASPVRSITSKQYNTPVAMYSDETIAESLSSQAEVLAGGVLGVNFKKNEKVYNPEKSEVLKALQENDSEPEPAGSTFYWRQSHAIGGSATSAHSPRPLTPNYQNMGKFDERAGTTLEQNTLAPAASHRPSLPVRQPQPLFKPSPAQAPKTSPQVPQEKNVGASTISSALSAHAGNLNGNAPSNFSAPKPFSYTQAAPSVTAPPPAGPKSPSTYPPPPTWAPPSSVAAPPAAPKPAAPVQEPDENYKAETFSSVFSNRKETWQKLTATTVVNTREEHKEELVEATDDNPENTDEDQQQEEEQNPQDDEENDVEDEIKGEHVGVHVGTYYQLAPSNIPQPTPRKYQSNFQKALIYSSDRPYQIHDVAPTPEPKLPNLDYYEIAIRDAENSKPEPVQVEEKPKQEIPKFEVKTSARKCSFPYQDQDVRQGTLMSAMMRTASPKPMEFIKSNAIEEVHLPDEIDAYFPPPISMEPHEPYGTLESYRTKSPFVGALTTIPDRPYTPFGREIMSQLAMELPKDTKQITFSNALHVAPDDSFDPSSLEYEFDPNPVEYTAKVYERIAVEAEDEEETSSNSAFVKVSSSPINRSFLPTIQPWSTANDLTCENSYTDSMSGHESLECHVSESRRCSEFQREARRRSSVAQGCPCVSRRCSEPVPTKPISDLLKPIIKEEEEFDPDKPSPNAIYPRRNQAPSPFENMQLKLTNKMTSNLHKPDEIPTYQRKWFNLPTQNPPRTPEPEELRENVPVAFHEWNSSVNVSRRSSISAADQQASSTSTRQEPIRATEFGMSSKPPIPAADSSSSSGVASRRSSSDSASKREERAIAYEAEDDFKESSFPTTKIIQVEGGFPTRGVRKNSIADIQTRQKVQFDKQKELRHELHNQQQRMQQKQKVRQQKELEMASKIHHNSSSDENSREETIIEEIQQNKKLSHYEMEQEYKRQLELERQQRQKEQELKQQQAREVEYQRQLEEKRLHEIKVREKRERENQMQAQREMEYQKIREEREEAQRIQQEARDLELKRQQEEMELEIRRQQEHERREAEKREAIRLFEIRRKEEQDRQLAKIEAELKQKREEELHRLEEEIREKREQREREIKEAEAKIRRDQKARDEAEREQKRLEEEAAKEQREREQKLQLELKWRQKQEAERKQREEMELFNIEEERKRREQLQAQSQPQPQPQAATVFTSQTYQQQTVWPPSQSATPAPNQTPRPIPIIRTDSEEELTDSKFRFEPLDEDQRRFMAGIRPPSTCYSPPTEDKPFPAIPYYQQHLVFVEKELHSGIFDPKRVSPVPNRSRSPAFGPPPNPLKAFVNKVRDPMLDDSGIYLCGERLLSPVWYDKQNKEIPPPVQRKIHSYGAGTAGPPPKPDLASLNEAVRRHKQESGTKPPPPPPPMPNQTNIQKRSTQENPSSNEKDENTGIPKGSVGTPGALPKHGRTFTTTGPNRGQGILTQPSTGRIPICGGCGCQVRGPFITALGRTWCPAHFLCVNPSCKRELVDIGFVEEKGDLYCEYCFEQFLAPPCSKCNIKIKGDCLNAIGRKFHPECFKCTYCGKLFGNSPFFLEEGEAYCEADWNELFTTKCFACGFPVEAGDRWVEALNNNYHSQCFNCTYCKKNLEGQSFFAKGGRPFCKNHAR